MRRRAEPGPWDLLARLIAGEHWRSMAACGTAEPDLFFPVSASACNLSQVARAKEICGRCLVRDQCLEFALETRQLHGIWGGTTEEERYRLFRTPQRRASAGETVSRADGYRLAARSGPGDPARGDCGLPQRNTAVTGAGSR